ncbi:MAG TPA: hypothetical protein VK400_11975 [Pyrinomonadaceae bacterium]|nr:hypothetical protein [Pyrinomonadaceae bacterium]
MQNQLQNQYAPCPKCSQSLAQKVSFTWWGGLLGPKLLSHVKCGSCGTGYNGKTGKDNTTNIVIYSIVAIVIAFFLMLILFFGLGVLTFMVNR